MIRRPPRSTPGRSSAASDVYKRQPVDSLINLAIADRNIVIGGTSAGMAILGGFYFTAKNGTVTSSAALSNPYTSRVTVDSASFIHAPFLEDVITDTHYDNPDRKGRHVTFLARILKDYGIKAKGIACDEYTAVCIGPDGIAIVYGDYPSNDDNAYFILLSFTKGGTMVSIYSLVSPTSSNSLTSAGYFALAWCASARNEG